MAQSPLSQAALLLLFADSQAPGSIVPQDVRDLIVTVVPTGAAVTSGATQAMTTTNLIMNYAVATTVAVTLPSLIAWQTATVKDYSGVCSLGNPWTVSPPSGNIDSAATFVMNQPHQSATFMFDGTNWSVI